MKTPAEIEVKSYAESIGFSIDSARFINYYQKRDWRLKNGKKMKCWKKAVQTWKTRAGKEAQPAKRTAKDIIAEIERKHQEDDGQLMLF